jgi:hypothetical protein
MLRVASCHFRILLKSLYIPFCFLGMYVLSNHLRGWAEKVTKRSLSQDSWSLSRDMNPWSI